MSFTERNAKSLVVGSVAAAGILASAEQLATGNPPNVRVAVGAILTGAMLYALTDAAPEVAGAFALLLLAGAVLTNGATVVNIITTATTKRK